MAVKDADAYLRDYKALTGEWGWVVGEVVESSERGADILKDAKILEV